MSNKKSNWEKLNAFVACMKFRNQVSGHIMTFIRHRLNVKATTTSWRCTDVYATRYKCHVCPLEMLRFSYPYSVALTFTIFATYQRSDPSSKSNQCSWYHKRHTSTVSGSWRYVTQSTRQTEISHNTWKKGGAFNEVKLQWLEHRLLVYHDWFEHVFWVPRKLFGQLESKYLRTFQGNFLILSWKYMLCVLIIIVSSTSLNYPHLPRDWHWE